MKKKSITLVHRAAMEIAVPAVESFARHFHDTHFLEIHTDGTPDDADEEVLIRAAGGMDSRVVRPNDRAPILLDRIAERPRTRSLLDGVGYNAKLELPMTIEAPYFYFDSDIIWLRPVANLEPLHAPNAFSTESWTWYHGVSNDSTWIRERIPRRVNSGFYYLGESFPFERMEKMLESGLFDCKKKYNTDQEIMAYLFPAMELYHPEDLRRSRRGVRYDLAGDPAAALHFPGGMWKEHRDQFNGLARQEGRDSMDVRFQDPVALTSGELFRMRARVRAHESDILGPSIRLVRKLLRGS